MFEGKVKTRLFSKYSDLFLVPILSMGFLVFLFWSTMRKMAWQLWVPLLCALIFVVYKSGLLKLDIGVFNLHQFTITTNGVVTKDGYLILWSQIKEVVFFSHCGYPHIGIKLKEGESFVDGKPVDELFGEDINWSVFKMPILTFSDNLNLSREELGKIFANDYKVPVRYVGKVIEAGNEDEL